METSRATVPLSGYHPLAVPPAISLHQPHRLCQAALGELCGHPPHSPGPSLILSGRLLGHLPSGCAVGFGDTGLQRPGWVWGSGAATATPPSEGCLGGSGEAVDSPEPADPPGSPHLLDSGHRPREKGVLTQAVRWPLPEATQRRLGFQNMPLETNLSLLCQEPNQERCQASRAGRGESGQEQAAEPSLRNAPGKGPQERPAGSSQGSGCCEHLRPGL